MTKLPPPAETCDIDHLVDRVGVDCVVVDRETLGRLYDATCPDIFRYCFRRTGNRSLAEDLTSAVFLSVSDNLKAFSGTTLEDFRRWVFTIATNEIRAHHRKTARRQDLLIDAANSGRFSNESSNEQSATDSSDALQAAIMKLDDRAQAIVTMRYISELPYEDIGKILNISPGAARTAASRALESIRNHIGNA